MANSLCGGDLCILAGKIKSFCKSVCSDLVPLDVGIVQLVCTAPVNYTINTDTVLKLLKKINVSQATGLGDISGWILREHALTLAHPACTIFTTSIREGISPSN